MASQLFPGKMACFATRRTINMAYAVPLPTTIVRYGRSLRTLAEFPRLTVPRGSIPREIAKKYQPFLLDPSVESSDWISELKLETVATMVQESMAEDHRRTKILVVFDSQYPRSPGKHVAYEASRLLHKLGFVVRALDLDSLEDRKVLRKNKKVKPQSPLNHRPSEDISAEPSPSVQEVPENKSLVRNSVENMPQSLHDHELQEDAHHRATIRSDQESQAPPAMQEESSHESNPPFASIEDPSKEEPQEKFPTVQRPKLKSPVRPVDRVPSHIPRPEKEFYELVMWADAQIWCFPEKTNDLLAICNRHFAERSGPLLQGQPVPILYFNDSPSTVYQSHAIRHTIGTRRKLVPIPARTDLQGIHAHPNQRMSENGTRTRFVNAVEDLAKYTYILCRKKNEATFKYKYSTEKATVKRQAAKSTALSGATQSIGSSKEPQDEREVVEKKKAFMRLLDLPKEIVISKVEPEEDTVQEEVRKRDQEAKLLRLKKLLGIKVSTEDSQATDEAQPQNHASGKTGGSEDSQIQEETQAPVHPRATEKTVPWSPLVRTGTENGAAKPSSFDSRD